MEVNVYVNWFERKILSEAEHKAKVLADATEYSTEEESLEDFLDEQNYCLSGVFNMTEEEKTATTQEFLEWCSENAEQDFRKEFVEFVMEIPEEG